MRRNTNDQIIAGVCSGLANEVGIDVTIIRLLFLFAFVIWGFGPLAYIILWILMKPEGGEE